MIEVKGADQLASTLHRAAGELDGLPEAHAQIAAWLAAQATRATPRRTGRLAAGNTGTSQAGQATVTNQVRYARPRHNGWKGHHGTPWLRQTLATAEPHVVATLTNQVQDILDNVKGA